MSDTSNWNEDVEFMREAIAQGVVDPTGSLIRNSAVSDKTLEVVSDNFESSGSPNVSEYENAGRSPKSIHWVSSTAGRIVHPGTAGITLAFAEWRVELARFSVPGGAVGVLKGFEQYLAQGDILQNPGFVYTQSSRWGIPFPVYTGLANPVTNTGTWHFRVHVIGKGSPAWINQTGAGELPDLPYTDYPFEDGLWYPAGSASCNNVHLLIPGGITLRVIYSTPEQDVQLEAAAKVRGFVQSFHTAECLDNVRTNW